MKVGVFLPSFLFPSQDGASAQRLRTFARCAEELGFDSLWITDHVVTARRFYSVAWLDSLMTLSHVAAITENVRLGTSILILPLRQPTLLAKEIATLHYLSGERFINGIGVGWFGPEFEACGVHKSERGARTDEVLDSILALLQKEEVEFEGRFFKLDQVTVEPHPRRLPPTWVGGGRQLVHETSPEAPRLNSNVRDRIARADGWIARPTCPPDMIATDMEEIRSTRESMSLTGKEFTVAHENFTWLVEGGLRDDIVAEQQRRFYSVMSDERPWDYLEAVYLAGTIDDIQERIKARVQAGVEYLMLHTLTDDLEQLELLAKHVLQPFQRVS
jgi:probable F420-dependent oxidoreductase